MATRYIALSTDGGNNSNSGTIGSPWLTLAHACANASVGDTIQFRGGTYTEVGVIIDERDTVTIENYPGENVIIQNNGVTYTYIYTFRDSRGILFRKNPSGGSITLRNFPTPILPTAGTSATPTVLGSAPAPGGKGNSLLQAQYTADAPALGVTINSLPWLTVDGVTMTDARGKCIAGEKIGVIVRNCDLSHGSCGVMCYGGSSAPMNGAVVENNNIHDMDKLWQDKRVVNGSGAMLEGDDAGAMGVHFNLHHYSTVDAIVHGNTIKENHCYSSGYGSDGAGVEIFRSGDVEICHNTFENNEIIVETGTDSGNTGIASLGSFHHNYCKGFLSTDSAGPGILIRNSGFVVYNNTFRLDGANGGSLAHWAIRFFADAGSFGNDNCANQQFYNNIVMNGPVVNSPGNILLRIDQGGARPVPTFTTLDYNLYYSQYHGTTDAIYHGGYGIFDANAAGWASYKAATPFADHDIWDQDPLLNADGTLQAGSPAIGAGLGGVDLGAFDYTSAGAQNVTAGRITVTSAVYAPTFVPALAIIEDDFEGSYPPTGYSEAGTAANIGTSTNFANSGATSMRVNNASAAQAWIANSGRTERIVTARFYLRVDTKVSGTSSIYQFTVAGGNVYLRLLTTGVIRLTLNATNYDGPTLNDDQWYLIDIRVNTSANPWVVDWAVDEAAQTQRTIAIAAADITAHNLGMVTSVTCDLYFDDYKLTDQSGDYPLGPIVTTQTVTAGLITNTAAIYSPLKITRSVTAGLIADTPQVFAPTFVLGAISVALARITQNALVFTPAAAATTTYVVDTYTRTVVNGWGTADQGGAYVSSGGAVSDYNVTSSIGTISATTNRDIRLLSVSARDITGTGRIAVNKIPTGTGGTYVDTTVRRIASPFTGYRFKVGFLVGGALVVGIGRNNASSSEVRLVNDQTPLAVTTFTANQWIRYRYICRNLTSGVATLQFRVWADGSGEPSTWDITTTDSTAGSLQSAGALTRFVYSDATLTNNPVTVSFDDQYDSEPVAVQAVSPAIISQTAQVYQPSFVKGGVSVAVARITQTATILAPSQIKQVVTIGKITQTASLSNVTLSVGAVAVSPGVITRTMVLNAPSLSLKVPVGLIAQTSQTFAPSVRLGVAVPLVASTTQVYGPIIGQYVGVGLIVASPQVYSFGSSFAISIPFINHAGVVYGPILAQLTAPGLIAVTPALYQPGVGATNQISVALIAAEVSVHGPTIGVALTFAVDLISQTASLYAPDIYAALASPMELIDSTAQMFAPSFLLVMPAFDLIAQSSTLYDPTFGYGVAVDLIALNSQLYQPELGAPGLAGRPPEIVTAVPSPPPVIVSAGVYTR